MPVSSPYTKLILVAAIALLISNCILYKGVPISEPHGEAGATMYCIRFTDGEKDALDFFNSDGDVFYTQPLTPSLNFIADTGTRLVLTSPKSQDVVAFGPGQSPPEVVAALSGTEPQIGIPFKNSSGEFYAATTIKNTRNLETDKIESKGQIEIIDLGHKRISKTLSVDSDVWFEARGCTDGDNVYFLGRVLRPGPAYGLGVLFILNAETTELTGTHYFVNSVGSPTGIVAHKNEIWVAGIYEVPGSRRDDSTGISHSIQILDKTSIKPVAEVSLGERTAKGLYYAPQSGKLVAHAVNFGRVASKEAIAFIDLDKKTIVKQVEPPYPIRTMSVSSTGKLYVTHGAGASVQEGLSIYNVDSGALEKEVYGEYMVLSDYYGHAK